MRESAKQLELFSEEGLEVPGSAGGHTHGESQARGLGQGEFEPGWRPVGHRLIVWPKDTEAVTAGGILIPHELQKREAMAQVEAVVVAVGPACWSDQKEVHVDSLGSRSLKVAEPWAKVGDSIRMAKFAGQYFSGRDEKMYRIISDLEVVAVES